jgi:hypothetical protein
MAGESFREHLHKLSIVCGEILSCAHGNFEQENGVLESFIIIINYYDIIIVKIIRENKVVESILRKPVWQPKTSHCF